ncbi:MAG: hypothetical protein ACOYED_05875 [Peptococcia bacterium]|jgi:hypothetical protein
MSTRRMFTIGGMTIVIMLILEIAFVHPHVYFWWHGFNGFDFLLGLLGSLLLLGLAKGPINWLVQREEDYYERGEDKP